MSMCLSKKTLTTCEVITSVSNFNRLTFLLLAYNSPEKATQSQWKTEPLEPSAKEGKSLLRGQSFQTQMGLSVLHKLQDTQVFTVKSSVLYACVTHTVVEQKQWGPESLHWNCVCITDNKTGKHPGGKISFSQFYKHILLVSVCCWIYKPKVNRCWRACVYLCDSRLITEGIKEQTCWICPLKMNHPVTKSVRVLMLTGCVCAALTWWTPSLAVKTERSCLRWFLVWLKPRRVWNMSSTAEWARSVVSSSGHAQPDKTHIYTKTHNKWTTL